MPKFPLALIAAILAAIMPFAGATAQTARNVTPPDTVDGPYRINSGDELEIYVWGEERLQRQVKVLPDGTITFPLVGQFTVQGLTLKEIENIVSEALRPEYRGEVPRVTASVVAASGLQFSVIGRVNAPGAFTPGRYVNVLEAISMAGGPSEFADLDEVLIVRKSLGGVTRYQAKLGPLFKKGASSSDLARANVMKIQSGDTIIVP